MYHESYILIKLIGILLINDLPVKIASPMISNNVLFSEHRICSLLLKVNEMMLNKNKIFISILHGII